ncbi:tRNA pseudouridine(55) synthase TruB [Tissierella sp. Yu-01]|uniref:tRNA pseudouridine(55) synthase TruB n=1 Tax=Tissierella sp. Yu-01 TaxID=3035694 RepID=UPI00240D4098|nr:tRNA pseudouridine(55) synthase TruB [Tissierella sp. Yu-01]WFA09759.1 tRNA pseudouridine(55) synthase TruB [Tissierella sp. Yu-01]
MDGVINLFKPRGMTSHDAVYVIRKIFKTKKVGHTGTLDPNATGVLPICIGKATRISEYLLGVDKEYIGELTLGFSTDTQDSDGVIINSSKKEVTEKEINDSFNKFKGLIYQIPPMYSALKVDGKKLYELAREGKTIERAPREVNIKESKILNNYNNKEIIFYTKCSRGTYIRTFCDDIGNDLGTYGYMSYLMRVGVGNFKIENSISIEALRNMCERELYSVLTPIDIAISHMEKINLDSDYYKKIINGALVKLDNEYSSLIDLDIRVYCKDKFIGIGKINQFNNENYLKMNKVFIGE